MTRKVSLAEATANTVGDWQECIKHAEQAKAPTMDWLGMEATLRAYVRKTKNYDVDAIVAAFTKRGNELPCPKCGNVYHNDGSCNG